MRLRNRCTVAVRKTGHGRNNRLKIAVVPPDGQPAGEAYRIMTAVAPGLLRSWRKKNQFLRSGNRRPREGEPSCQAVFANLFFHLFDAAQNFGFGAARCASGRGDMARPRMFSRDQHFEGGQGNLHGRGVGPTRRK